MNTPKPASKPHYLRIRDFILDGIRSRSFAPGAKIPPEVELAKQFGVSRMTVNKAIRDLAEAGVLLRYAGDGTYVAERKAESPLLDVNNIAEEIALRGHAYRAEVHFVREEAASEEVALRLTLGVGMPVFHSLIVHFEDDTPIQLEDRYINPQWAPDYLAQDFGRDTPNAYLMRACPLTDVEHTVEAVLPDVEAQSLLGLQASEPCLRVLRRTWSGKHLVSFARLLHPGAGYKLRSQTRVRK
ncbi:histidine utilization repressor [Vogesella fluminis]|uniref:Histidine utilization repressor n=1 Tax=Vogesella fluminis TaxID=1069161 RepID=A0ABQ3H4U5_9NEIS|nr:histidine utilization repressor [Vogesella fluminis]GHD70695.1 histidine utilization repressor [Vogesella fluminis]